MKKELEKVRAQIVKAWEEQTKKDIESIKKETAETLPQSWFKSYLTEREKQKPLKDQKTTIIKKATRKNEKEKAQTLASFDEITRTTKTPDGLSIVVEWSKGGAYGWQAKATTHADGLGYFEGGKTGGCGYDKLSSAVAYSLNNIKEISRMLLEKLGKLSNKKILEILKGRDCRDIFGYGVSFSRFKSLVYFDYGVGIGSTLGVLERLGYKRKTEQEGSYSNFYYLEKKRRV